MVNDTIDIKFIFKQFCKLELVRNPEFNKLAKAFQNVYPDIYNDSQNLQKYKLSKIIRLEIMMEELMRVMKRLYGTKFTKILIMKEKNG